MSQTQPTPKSLTFWDHLEELRKRFFVIGGAFLLAFIVCLFFAETFLEFLLIPIRSEMERVYFLAPQEAFFVNLKTAFFFAVFLSSPVIFYQLWLFLEPGLLASEKKIFLPAVLTSLLLFVAGAGFAFFIVLPIALNFFLGFSSEHLRPIISVGKYISFVSTLSLGFGCTFVIPVFLLGLIRTGTLSRETLKKQRPLVLIVILILAAVFTPPDIISQIALALPLWLLFEATLLVSKWATKRPGK